MADPTYEIHTHITQYKLEPNRHAAGLKIKTKTQYQIRKVQYQNAIPNPPPSQGAGVPRHGEAVTRGCSLIHDAWIKGSQHFSMWRGHFYLFISFLRLTVIPGPPLFSLTVQQLDPFPCRVEFIKDVQ